MKIIERVHRTAVERGATPVVLTFDPHPTRVVRPDKAPPLLMTEAQKVEVLERRRHARRGDRPLHGGAVALGAGDVRARRAGGVAWRVARCGSAANFLFGRDRSGTFAVLRSLGERYGFRADKIDPVCVHGAVVSSTRVRRLLAEGRVDEAGVLLGRHFFIDGQVVGGRRAGPRAGVPDGEPQDGQRDWCRRTASTRPSRGRGRVSSRP